MSKKRSKHGPRPKNEFIAVMRFPKDPDTPDPGLLEGFPEHAQYIAYIIAEWSHIEYRMAMWLALRLSTDKHIILPMVYSLETSRARFDMMASGLRDLLGDHPQVRGKLEQLLKRVDQALRLRNKYAHAYYGQDGDSMELAIAGLGKKKPVNLPLHELKHHFAQLRTLTHQLDVILAAEFGLPLGGPDAIDTVPAHPLGIHAVRTRPSPPTPPGPSPESLGDM